MTVVRTVVLLTIGALLVPELAAAASDRPPEGGPLLLPEQQFYAALIGLLCPLVAYVLNRVGPQIRQPVKAAVQVAVAAVAGALYQLLDAGTLGFDTATLQVVATSVVAALAAHLGLYKPANINARLGGYRDGEAADA